MPRRRACFILVAAACAALVGGCSLFQNRPPEASFVARYDVDPEDPLVVELDASISTDPDGDAIVAYQWTFGDDDVTILTPLDATRTVTVPVIRIRYPVEGTYVVALVVRDEYGNGSQPVSKHVTVPNVPVEPTE